MSRGGLDLMLGLCCCALFLLQRRVARRRGLHTLQILRMNRLNRRREIPLNAAKARIALIINRIYATQEHAFVMLSQRGSLSTNRRLARITHENRLVASSCHCYIQSSMHFPVECLFTECNGEPCKSLNDDIVGLQTRYTHLSKV